MDVKIPDFEDILCYAIKGWLYYTRQMKEKCNEDVTVEESCSFKIKSTFQEDLELDNLKARKKEVDEKPVLERINVLHASKTKFGFLKRGMRKERGSGRVLMRVNPPILRTSLGVIGLMVVEGVKKPTEEAPHADVIDDSMKYAKIKLKDDEGGGYNNDVPILLF